MANRLAICGHFSVEPMPDGDFVSYSDYAALEARAEAAEQLRSLYKGTLEAWIAARDAVEAEAARAGGTPGFSTAPLVRCMEAEWKAREVVQGGMDHVPF